MEGGVDGVGGEHQDCHYHVEEPILGLEQEEEQVAHQGQDGHRDAQPGRDVETARLGFLISLLVETHAKELSNNFV